MPIVGRPETARPPYWTNRALYRLRDCECGGKQDDGNVYTIFVGSNNSFWAIKCRLCGKVSRGRTQEEVTKVWNGHNELERNCN